MCVSVSVVIVNGLLGAVIGVFFFAAIERGPPGADMHPVAMFWTAVAISTFFFWLDPIDTAFILFYKRRGAG